MLSGLPQGSILGPLTIIHSNFWSCNYRCCHHGCDCWYCWLLSLLLFLQLLALLKLLQLLRFIVVIAALIMVIVVMILLSSLFSIFIIIAVIISVLLLSSSLLSRQHFRWWFPNWTIKQIQMCFQLLWRCSPDQAPWNFPHVHIGLKAEFVKFILDLRRNTTGTRSPESAQKNLTFVHLQYLDDCANSIYWWSSWMWSKALEQLLMEVRLSCQFYSYYNRILITSNCFFVYIYTHIMYLHICTLYYSTCLLVFPVGALSELFFLFNILVTINLSTSII